MFKENITKYKQILIAADTYDALNDLGRTGDSFNAVIQRLINKDSTKGERV